MDISPPCKCILNVDVSVKGAQNLLLLEQFEMRLLLLELKALWVVYSAKEL